MPVLIDPLQRQSGRMPGPVVSSATPAPSAAPASRSPFPDWAIGVLVGTLLLCVVVYIPYRRHKRKKGTGEHAPAWPHPSELTPPPPVEPLTVWVPPVGQVTLWTPPRAREPAPQPVVKKAAPFEPDTLARFTTSGPQREQPCSVCLEPLGAQVLAAGACGHAFHAICIARWLTKDDTRSCPVCRAPFAGPLVAADTGTPPLVPVE